MNYSNYIESLEMSIESYFNSLCENNIDSVIVAQCFLSVIAKFYGSTCLNECDYYKTLYFLKNDIERDLNEVYKEFNNL